MKKLIAVILTLALLLCGACSLAEAPLAGGWTTADTGLTEAALAAFDTAISKLVGCNYEPIAVLGTQVVAGTNYCFFAEIAPVYPGAQYHPALMFIYADLSGDGTVTQIRDLEIAPGAGEAPMPGGWTITDPELSDDANAAFDTAISELVGCSYEPIALLATQVVAGINYCILTKITPVYPDAQSHPALMFVYADLSGSATVTEIRDLDIAAEAEAPAEEEDGQNPFMNLIGEYMDTLSERASLHVECIENNRALMIITWANSAFETVEWLFTADYDEETGEITYSDCIKSILTYDEDDNESAIAEYTDGTGMLTVTDDWHLEWRDGTENLICDFVFVG